MTIRLTKDLERILHDAVRAGVYAREDEVIPDLLARLRESLPENASGPDEKARKARDASPSLPATRKLSVTEIQRRMLASGFLTQLPDPAQDLDDDAPDDPPVLIEGEPLSETIIRERR